MKLRVEVDHVHQGPPRSDPSFCGETYIDRPKLEYSPKLDRSHNVTY
jgi:hypothetical protein